MGAYWDLIDHRNITMVDFLFVLLIFDVIKMDCLLLCLVLINICFYVYKMVNYEIL